MKMLPCLCLMTGCLISLRCESAETIEYIGTKQIFLSPADQVDQKFQSGNHEISPSGLADELTGYLNQIDEAAWTRVVDDFEGAGVVLALKESPLVTAAEREQLASMNPEGYLIDIDSQSIRVVGNTVLALQHAMFDLLERLGCRFLTPAEAWTIIPQKTGLKLSKGKSFEQPDYISRMAFFTGGGAEGWDPDGSLKAIGESCRQWDRKTRQGAYSSLSFGHTWGSIIWRNKEAFIAHPEYFRMNEQGERESFANHPRGDDPSPEAMHFCVSNPELQALCVKDRLALLEELQASNPTQQLVSMDPNDGHQPCHCDQCKALGNVSDRVYSLANHVARELRMVKPEALVGVMIYSPFDTPPQETRIEPNIVTMMALAFNQSGLSYDELARGWKKAGVSQMLVYPYFGIVQWTNAMPASSPTYEQIARDIPFFQKQWNVVATLQETGSTWGRMGPAMYLARKLLWDIDVDAAAVYDSYFHDAFGAGAPQMRRLYDLWDMPCGAKLSDTNIDQWMHLAAEAIRATEAESPEVKRRVEDVLAYLHYTTLFHEANNLRQAGDETRMLSAMQKLYTFNWRIRERQVVQTWGSMYFLFNWLNPYFKEGWRSSESYEAEGYEKSTPWTIYAQRDGKAVWQRDDTEVTSAEIRKLFDDDVALFSEKAAVNRTFSDDLVPLFDGPAVEPTFHPENSGLLRTTGRWHFYVDKPTKLRITFQTQVHSSEHDKPDHIHEARVIDPSGQVIFLEQPAPFDGGNGKASVSVIDLDLGTGLHRLEARGGWNSPFRPVFTPAVKYTHEQSPAFSTPTHYYTPGYFYVPKGTAEVRLNNNGYVSIKAPSWKQGKVFDEKTAAGLNRIEVTAGDDGQVWKVYHVSTNEYQLLNVPPYIALAAENLLIPREIQQSDGPIALPNSE
ncbi:MAG TPA: DUF4838 domain-containing protein [Planctomycetaceae bacterium]|nr:DUF4838 domain-containing protein [Planctomycetaceae bacterium]HQZ66275.1 DUF4838 domain-containing protein [Planctomycetaceae bacterium]